MPSVISREPPDPVRSGSPTRIDEEALLHRWSQKLRGERLIGCPGRPGEPVLLQECPSICAALIRALEAGETGAIPVEGDGAECGEPGPPRDDSGMARSSSSAWLEQVGPEILMLRSALIEELAQSDRRWSVQAQTSAHRLLDELYCRIQARSREAVQMRDEFIAIAAHELRSPVHTIRLQLELLLHQLDDGSEGGGRGRLRGSLERAQSQVDHLTRLLRNLVDVSHIGWSRASLHLCPVDLAEVVREVAGRLEDLCARMGTPIEVRTEVPLVGRWDRFGLELVVSNLLTNAVKFGCGKPVQLKVEAAGDQVILRVRDDGAGIPTEHQERIFQKYARVEGTQRHAGLGLGLYVVRRIVEAHGGSIRVVSQPGQGATFEVHLPLSAP